MHPHPAHPHRASAARRVGAPGNHHVVFFFLLPLALLPLAGCLRPEVKVDKEKGKPLPEVYVSSPVTETVTEFEDFTGYLAAENTIEIRPRVSGYLERLHFTDGAEVKAGQVLCEIDARFHKATADNAAALLNQAVAKRDGLLSQNRRAQDLVKRDAISTEAAELIQYQLQEAEASVIAAEATKTLADLEVTYTKVTSPIDGVISNRRIDVGNLAKADDTILATVVSQDPIYAYFDVNERTVLRLRRLIQDGKIKPTVESGLEVYASLADEDDFKHQGKVNFVDNQLDPATGTLRVRAEIANPARLFSPGLFVRIRFPIGSPRPSLLIPEEALISDQGGRFLYVLNDQDEVVYRGITIGAARGGKRVIEEGLRDGERVVISGLQRVKEGDKVIPKSYEEHLKAIAAEANEKIKPAADAATNAKPVSTTPTSPESRKDKANESLPAPPK